MTLPAGTQRLPAVVDLQAVQLQLASALGPHIGIACTNTHGDPARLGPIEQLAIQRAVPRRQQEFAAGRAAAREAMSRIGLPPADIPQAADRSPIWPDGVVGSIAHTTDVCIAIVARKEHVAALGIDVENDHPMDTALWDLICTPAEQAMLEDLPDHQQGRTVTRLFCAKEAYYKWQFPQTGQLLDFKDVQIEFADEHRRFHPHDFRGQERQLGQQRPCGHILTLDGLTLAWL